MAVLGYLGPVLIIVLPFGFLIFGRLDFFLSSLRF